ncbi:autotransporter outer membrane beta-barrel domain-containing protein [Candidatus Odyssella acanthamoebae]|uniref:Autotransporter domain-containing protein n=1 Tax=Candidatus Odyssella acanthamoebae TaxID=91604 RepID=A0A077AXW3_9PROT|nr:autotransporter outer membrane beta-barrel domain-containing protein [Candidatus Paracaedibacter acanthamoebae]AIK96463.1 hypothetical protein ID47_06465 [Candidatus Paracaedibacter acanthamoebae]
MYVIPRAGDYSGGFTYTILEAGTSLAGTFSAVTGASPLLGYKLSYDYVNKQVSLTVSPVALGSIIKEGNGGIIAQHIDSLGSLSSTSVLKRFENAIFPLPTADVYEAFNQIHPTPNGLISSSVMTNEFNQMDGIVSFSFLDRNAHMIKDQLKAAGANITQLNANVAPINSLPSTGRGERFGKTFRFSDLYTDGMANSQSMPQNVRTTVGGTTLWAQQTGSYIDQESKRDGSATLGVAGVKSRLTDTSAGVDTLVTEKLRMGATVGYGKTTYHLRQGYGKGKINSYRVGLYSVWEFVKDWYANASAFYGYHDFKGKRTLTLTGVKYTNSQTHHGYHMGGMTEVGRDFAVTKEITITPYGGFGGLYFKEGGYVEKAEGLNPSLTVHKHNNSFIQAKTGVQASRVFNVRGMHLYIYGKMGYIYKKNLHNSQGIKASFTGYAGNFQVFVRDKAQNMMNPGIGGSILLANNISLTGNYNAELSSKLRIHQATLNLTYMF